MNVFEEIKSLSFEQLTLSVLAFLGALAPGFLIVYLFKPELFIQLSFLKLSVFSLAFTLPVYFANFIMVTTLAQSDGTNRLVDSAIAFFFSIFVFYPSIVVSYFLGWQFSSFLISLIILAFVMVMAIGGISIFERRG